MPPNKLHSKFVAKFIKRVPEEPGCSEVIVREDGGLIDIEQDSEVIELSPEQAILLRAALLDALTDDRA